MLTLHLLLEIEAVQEKNDMLHDEVIKKAGVAFSFFSTDKIV
jgi:hypothetical protein